MRSVSRSWGMLGLTGVALAGAFTACGGLDSANIINTDDVGLGGQGTGSSSGVNGFAGEAPVLTDPPSVVGVEPADEADDVEPNVEVVVEFTEALDESTVTDDSVYVLDGEIKVPGTLSYSNGHVVFTPDAPLSLLASYAVHVTTDVHDTTDQALTAEFSSGFVTRDGTWGSEASFREADTFLRPSKPDAQGNVMVAWDERNGDGKSDVYVALISPTGEVGEPKLIESLDTSCYGPEIAMSPEGNAVVAWTNALGQDLPNQVWARRYVDGQWEESEQRVESILDADNDLADGPFVGVSKGTFTVGWIRSVPETGNTNTYLEFTKATGTGAWDATPFIIDNGISAAGTMVRTYGVSIDFGSDGGGTVVYTYDDDPAVRTLRSAFFATSTSSWSVGAVLRPSEDLAIKEYCGACFPVVTRSASGGALLTWANSEEGSSEINLLASHFDKTNGWSAPMTVDNAAGNVFVYEGGVATFGNQFAVVWKQDNQTIFSPLVSIYDVADGTWTEPKLLSDGEGNNWYDGPKVVADAHGNLMAAWSQGGDLGLGSDPVPNVHFSRFNHLEGTWSAPTPLPQGDLPYTGVQLTALANGPVYALLSQWWDEGPALPYLAVFK